MARSDGEAVDDLVVARLSVAEGDARVDLQAGARGMARVGLDQGVVDALGLQPREQEVPQPVGGMLCSRAADVDYR